MKHLVSKAHKPGAWPSSIVHRFRLAVRLLLGVVMFAFFFSGWSRAQTFQPAAKAPAAWIEYANGLKSKSEAVLSADDATARRFHEALQKLTTAGDTPPPLTLTVKMWVGRGGKVERVSFAPLQDAAANADLTTLLTSVSAGAPPSDMLQPVRLKLSLEPRH